jgi:hypothetical protein
MVASIKEKQEGTTKVCSNLEFPFPILEYHAYRMWYQQLIHTPGKESFKFLLQSYSSVASK